jgi:hypothetical protein
MTIMDNNISGLEGSVITYYCQWSMRMPNERILGVATCLRNGSWSPDLQEMECPSQNIIHYNNITTGFPINLGITIIKSLSEELGLRVS